MTLIRFGRSRCPLCEEPIQEQDRYIVTPMFVVSETDSMWNYSGAPLHQECFLGWPRRAELVQRVNIKCGGDRVMAADGSMTDRPLRRRTPPPRAPWWKFWSRS